jgi:hypothetical protein
MSTAHLASPLALHSIFCAQVFQYKACRTRLAVQGLQYKACLAFNILCAGLPVPYTGILVPPLACMRAASAHCDACLQFAQGFQYMGILVLLQKLAVTDLALPLALSRAILFWFFAQGFQYMGILICGMTALVWPLIHFPMWGSMFSGPTEDADEVRSGPVLYMNIISMNIISMHTT